MTHLLQAVCNDKSLRKALLDDDFLLCDPNDVFQGLDFINQSMRLNHRSVFDTIAARGGTAALDAILATDTTQLTKDAHAANAGMVAVRGVAGYYIKTNTSALVGLTSILNAILAYGDVDDEFDPQAVSLTTDVEEYQPCPDSLTTPTTEGCTPPTFSCGGDDGCTSCTAPCSSAPAPKTAQEEAEDDGLEEVADEMDDDEDDEDAAVAAFETWKATLTDAPCPINFVTKGGTHCFYSDAENKFLTLNLPESWEEGAPTKPLASVAEYEALTWTPPAKEESQDDSDEFASLADFFPPEDSDLAPFTFGYKFRLEGEETWGFISADFQHITPTDLTNFAITKDANLLADCRKHTDFGLDMDSVNLYCYDFKLGSLIFLPLPDYDIEASEDVLSKVTLEIRSPYRDHRLGRSENDGGYRNVLLYHTTEGLFTRYIDRTTGDFCDCRFSYPVMKFWKNNAEHGNFTIVEYADRESLTLTTIELALSQPNFPITNDSGAAYHHYIGRYYGKHYFVRTMKNSCYGLYELDFDEESLRTVLPCQYEAINALSFEDTDNWATPRSLVLVRKEGYWGMYDVCEENFVLPCAFSKIAWFDQNELILCLERFGKLGLYKFGMNHILPCAFTDISKTEKGRFLITRYGKVGLCDGAGTQYIPCEYDTITLSSDEEGEEEYVVTKMDFEGAISLFGEWKRPLTRKG